MKNTIYMTGVSLMIACSSSWAQSARSAAPQEKTAMATAGAPAQSTLSPASETFLAALKARDAVRVAQLLAEDPALANTHRPDGLSVVLLALSLPDGESFLRPQSNPFLRAILERRPTLDAFEAAAVGDVQRVTAEIERDPSFVRAVHAPPIAWTALQFAAFGGQLETAKLLLKHGADVRAIAQTKFRNTPLQIALLTGQVEVMKLLLAHGAEANARQAGGFAAMHEAAQLDSEPLIRVLHDAGADVNARADDGTTPLDVAIKHNRKQAADALRRLGAKPGRS